MTSRSPFSQNRYEYEEQHFYFLPQKIFDLLEASTPTYLIGTRGTGKTTLLQALHWKERLENDSLRSALGEDRFREKYIGVYVKLPRTQINLIDRWLGEDDDDTYSIVLGTYLDLIALELIVDGISHLLDRRVINCAPSSEIEWLTSLQSSIDGTSRFETDLNSIDQLTLGLLYQHLNAAREHLQVLALTKASISEFAAAFPVSQPGDLCRRVTPTLAKLCDNGSAEWHFKVCMDEGEHLSVRQQRVINAIVRLAEWPCLPVVSFVNVPQSETTLHGMTLQKADRQLLIIEELLDDLRFKELVEGVATVRAKRLSGDEALRFSCESILGALDINHLLEGMLRDSVSQSARRLELLAHKLKSKSDVANHDEAEDVAVDDDRPSSAPPIYEAYLIDKLSLSPPAPESDARERYRFRSIEIRKRIVTAYLSIFRDFGKQRPVYASARMLLQMSDRCMRDFLWQMHEVFAECNLDLRSFFSHRAPVSKQDAGMHRASVNKQERVPSIITRSPQQTLKIVEGLSETTALVQSLGGKATRLLTSERGIFQLSAPSKFGREVAHLSELIIEAGNGGFLRLLSIGSDVWEFRVHASLAAAYGFSYRGAYSSAKCSLKWGDVARFSEASNESERKRIAKDVASRIIGEDHEQLKLFEDGQYE